MWDIVPVALVWCNHVVHKVKHISTTANTIDEVDTSQSVAMTPSQYYIIFRDHFVYAPNQWETTLHCNVVSHWLGAYTKWSLHFRSVTPHEQIGEVIHVIPSKYAISNMTQQWQWLQWYHIKSLSTKENGCEDEVFGTCHDDVIK